MKIIRGIVFCCAIVSLSLAGMAQTAKPDAKANAVSPATRYFKLILVLRYPESADGVQQSISTDVAVSDGRPGKSKMSMGSQLPVTMKGKTEYIDVGTKFDCDNVHLEGDGLAVHMVLETSRVNGTIHIKNTNGVDTEEPVISQRKMELSVKLVPDIPKVVFDTKTMDVSKLKPIGPGPATLPAGTPSAPEAMQVEMTAIELK